MPFFFLSCPYLRRSFFSRRLRFAWLDCLKAATPRTSLVNDQTPLLVSLHDTPPLSKTGMQVPPKNPGQDLDDDQVKKFFVPCGQQLKVD